MDARLPEVPKLTEGRKKLTSMMAASSPDPYVAGPSVSGVPIKYRPKMGPTGQNPLTTEQAKQLIQNSFPNERYKVVAPYEKDLIRQIVTKSANTPPAKRRAFSTLDRLSKHICSYEVLAGNITRAVETTNRIKEDPDSTPEMITAPIKSALEAIAAHIVDGYDFVDEDHFEFDQDGNPIKVNETNRERKPNCYNYLMKPILDRAQSADFREFLQKQSDPFKGSQQGVGRTRKHKKRSKKTLRRRKVRRNMH